MKQCDDISALSRELDIDRRLLYRWRDQLDPPDKSKMAATTELTRIYPA
jgi:transposase-like protein